LAQSFGVCSRERNGRIAVWEGIETPILGLHSIEECRPLVGDETVERILAKASALQDLHIVNISSTQYGGSAVHLRVDKDWRFIAREIK
jgi:hypothetical protein